jgi:hypothetical protein
VTLTWDIHTCTINATYGNFAVMEIVAHIGPHRTATTSLQELLDGNREKLIEYGIYYPKYAIDSKAHHVLAWACQHRNMGLIGHSNEIRSCNSILKDWLNEAQDEKCGTLLVSSEEFAKLRIADWKSLVESCGKGHHWTLVAAFRSPDEIAQSTYAQLLRSGLTQDFDELAEGFKRGAHDFYDFYDEFVTIADWCDSSLVQYSKLTDVFLIDMCETLLGGELGRLVIGTSPIERLNVRPNVNVSNLLLEFNRHNFSDFKIDLKTFQFSQEFEDGQGAAVVQIAKFEESLSQMNSYDIAI